MFQFWMTYSAGIWLFQFSTLCCKSLLDLWTQTYLQKAVSSPGLNFPQDHSSVNRPHAWNVGKKPGRDIKLSGVFVWASACLTFESNFHHCDKSLQSCALTLQSVHSRIYFWNSHKRLPVNFQNLNISMLHECEMHHRREEDFREAVLSCSWTCWWTNWLHVSELACSWWRLSRLSFAHSTRLCQSPASECASIRADICQNESQIPDKCDSWSLYFGDIKRVYSHV